MIEVDAAAVAQEQKLRDEGCRAQLKRIVESGDFEATARERRFLSYVVEEALLGRGSRIKAYTIAVEVFGRDASFDPQSDPIVRIEAGHLRRSLERYYLTAGQCDSIVITIPKGGYVPTFSVRPQPVLSDVPAPFSPTANASNPRWLRPSWLTVMLAAVVAGTGVLAWQLASREVRPTVPDVPRLFVKPFDDLSGTIASSAITRGLRQEVIAQLSKFHDLVIVESTGQSVALPRFALAGSVNLAGDTFRLRVQFTNQADGSVLWANSYDGGLEVAEVLAAEADIASNVATSLAQSYGVIYQSDAARNLENPPDDWEAYSCTLLYYAYRATLDPKSRSKARACLEKAVERFPNYATAWGLLAHLAIDEVRFKFPYDAVSSPTGIDRALTMARRAVELDPRNIRALHAEMSALFFSKQFDAARKVGGQARAMNPNDTELLGEYGTRLALSGSWDEGCPLVMEARGRNPGPFGYYEATLALCSYFRNDIQEAAMWIQKTPVSRNANYHAVAAAIFGEAGMKVEAERERIWLEQNAPPMVKNFRQELSVRFGRPQDVDFFLSSLRKAGLALAD